MKLSTIVFTSLSILMLSCTSKVDPDISLIETIENNLLPSVLVEGEEVEVFSILDPVRGMTTVYRPSLQGLAIEQADPLLLSKGGAVQAK